MKKTIHSPKAPTPIGPYSQAVQAGGFLYISGQLAINPESGKLIGEDAAAQTKQVMENIQAILEAAGYGLGDVVQVNVYLASMTDFEGFNREYARYFSGYFPARATVACTLKAGALLEISATAYRE
ncbi:MAG: Rid family detoxifying hydrolase [Candidatus Bathyarchaeota archaeon]|nr:Rid family detoxifying hydrolase [Candidatus Bathyarchaeota archaeon]